jgi:large subunit ribosomal protein L13
MTPFIKKKDIKKDWYIINAQNAVVGRLAAYISKVLRGKNKTTYNPHIDNGDFVCNKY